MWFWFLKISQGKKLFKSMNRLKNTRTWRLLSKFVLLWAGVQTLASENSKTAKEDDENIGVALREGLRVPLWFHVGFHGFHGFRLVFMVFHGSRLVFHGTMWVFFMVFHCSRLVFHSSRSVFMVFYGSRLVFHFFTQKLYSCRTIQSRPCRL